MKEDIKVRNSAEKNIIETQRERNKQIVQKLTIMSDISDVR